MALLVNKVYPKIHILSQIPQLYQCVKNIAPDNVAVTLLNLPHIFNEKSTLSSVEIDLPQDIEVCLADASLVAEVHEYLPNLKWVHSTWAGVEPFLIAVENKKNVPTFKLTRHGTDEFSSFMSEYIICQILNWERKMHVHIKHQLAKKWFKTSSDDAPRTLNNLEISILGVGNMGFGVAKRLHNWGSTVCGFSKNVRSPDAKEYSVFHRISTDVKEVIARCDYIVNTLPSTSQTCGLLNGTILRNCEKKPVFINVGRGNIIKEQDIVEAIRNQWISGAILDVFEEEPLPEASKLWEMPEVIITPHIAALSTAKHASILIFS